MKSCIKEFQYEDIRHKQHEFDTLTQAISEHHPATFHYSKVGSDVSKSYRIAPYHPVSKNGIWYLVGTDNGKQKTFCFNRIEQLSLLPETFMCNKSAILI